MDVKKAAAGVLAGVAIFAGGYAVGNNTEESTKPPVAVTAPLCHPGEVRTPDGKCLVVGTPPETAVGSEEALKLREPKVGAPFQSTSPIQVSDHGVKLVADFEGFSSCPYWDPYGRVATRGYGETDFHDTFGGRCITYISKASSSVLSSTTTPSTRFARSAGASTRTRSTPWPARRTTWDRASSSNWPHPSGRTTAHRSLRTITRAGRY